MAIAAGDHLSLALRLDGTVTAWGSYNFYGQTNVPTRLRGVVGIAAGTYHSLAVTGDGSVVAWGFNNDGEINLPAGLTNVIAVSAGDRHSVALKGDGSVIVWGSNAYGQTNVPPDVTNVVAIGAGVGHSLALRGDGKVLAWGGGASVPTFLSNAVAIAGGNDLALVSEMRVFMTLQPPSRKVFTGWKTIFRALAGGSAPVSYQWRRNGNDLPGATNTFLEIPLVSPSDAADYSVRAFNELGAALSRNATLIPVTSPPINLIQPTDQIGYLGGGAQFSTEAEGSRPQTYQWHFGDTGIGGGTNAMLHLSNLVFSQSGTYSVTLSNTYGSVESSNVDLAVVQVAAWGDNTSGQSTLKRGLTNLVSVAAGGDHNLGLRLDGTVVAWGNEEDIALKVPLGLSNVMAIAAGPIHSLALKSDGSVVGWGRNLSGQLSIAVEATNLVAIAAGENHSIALRDDGMVVGWGWYEWGVVATPPVGLENVRAISAGARHSLALKEDGTVTGWGLNGSGQLNIPPGLNGVQAIAAGSYHNLALRNDGSVVAWGRTNEGQAVVPDGLTNVMAIAAGGNSSYALKSDGTVVAWGANAFIQVTPPSDLREVTAIAAGRNHCLALLGKVPAFLSTVPFSEVASLGSTVRFRAGAVGSGALHYQWQRNESDLPGATNTTLLMADVNVAAHAGRYRVIVSNEFGSAASPTATLNLVPVAGWGQNNYGELNLFPELADTRQIAAGLETSLVIKRDGNVLAWGYYRYVPWWGMPAGAIAANYDRFLVVRSDGVVRGWGSDVYSPGVTGAVNVAAAQIYSMALQANGRVVAWGWNLDGGTNIPFGLRRVVAIAGGGRHSLALQTHGRVAAWGWNAFGQAAVPPELNGVVAVAAGLYHSLALKSDGTVVAWGQGAQAIVPVGLSDVVEIAAAANHSLALKRDGTVVGWGSNDLGQITVPSWLRGVVSIAAGSGHSLALMGDGLPEIVAEPMDQTAPAGETVTFLAKAIGSLPLRYQWQFNENNIEGETNRFLIRSHLTFADSGTYRVAVSNSFSGTLSRNARLEVRMPLRIESIDHSADGNVTLYAGFVNAVPLTSEESSRYVIYASTNLTEWTALAAVLNWTNGQLFFRDQVDARYPRRYYRIIEP